jgi:hypothetical protein
VSDHSERQEDGVPPSCPKWRALEESNL